MSDLIDPDKWLQASKQGAEWLQQDLGMKAGVIIAIVLGYFAVVHFIRVLRQR